LKHQILRKEEKLTHQLSHHFKSLTFSLMTLLTVTDDHRYILFVVVTWLITWVLTQQMPLVGQVLLVLPEQLSSSDATSRAGTTCSSRAAEFISVLIRVCIAQSVVFCGVLWPIVGIFVLYLLTIVCPPSIMVSDNPLISSNIS
jgi:hypothetical protein